MSFPTTKRGKIQSQSIEDGGKGKADERKKGFLTDSNSDFYASL